MDLPAINMEQHHIDLKDNVVLVHAKQQRMASDKMGILKVELDRLLEGGFITPAKNTK